MINYLFATPVYATKNTDLISAGNQLFDMCEPRIGHMSSFKTTLKDKYSPYKARVLWDPLETQEVIPLANFIKDSVVDFLKQGGWNEKAYDIIIVNMWMNEMKTGANHPVHTHYGYSLSGTYYVELPEEQDMIMFHHHQQGESCPWIEEVTAWMPHNSMTWWLPVEAGSLVLFPSNIKHSVPSREFKGLRKSIAFDIILRVKDTSYAT